MQVEHIQDQEWLESIRHSYQPAQIDEGLWIIPSWCQPEDASAVNIILEPGIAFGTGDHPTTRLCLKALLDLDLQGKIVVDYGTGQGSLLETQCLMCVCALLPHAHTHIVLCHENVTRLCNLPSMHTRSQLPCDHLVRSANPSVLQVLEFWQLQH